MNEIVDISMNINIDKKSVSQQAKDVVNEVDKITAKANPIQVIDVAEMAKAEKATRKFISLYEAESMSLAEVEKHLARVRKERERVTGATSDESLMSKSTATTAWTSDQEAEFQRLLTAQRNLTRAAEEEVIQREYAKREEVRAEQEKQAQLQQLQQSEQSRAEAEDKFLAEQHENLLQRKEEEQKAYQRVGQFQKEIAELRTPQDLIPRNVTVDITNAEKEAQGLKQAIDAITETTDGTESSRLASLRNQLLHLSKLAQQEQAKIEQARSDIEGIDITPQFLSTTKEYKDTYAQLVAQYEESHKHLTESATELDAISARLETVKAKLQSLPSLESAMANQGKLASEKDFAAGMIDRQIEQQMLARAKALQEIQRQSQQATDPSMQAEYDFMAKNLTAAYDNTIAKLQSAKEASNSRYDAEIQKLQQVIDLHNQYNADIIAQVNASSTFERDKVGVEKDTQAIEKLIERARQAEQQKIQPKIDMGESKLEDIVNKLNVAILKYQEMGEKAEKSTNKASSGTRNLQKATTSLRGSLKDMLSVYGNAFKSFSKTFNRFSKRSNRSLKTILRAIIGVRGLYMLIRKIKSMISEGFGDLIKVDDEAFTNSVNGLKAVKAGMTDIKNMASQLKYSLASAFMPIVELAIPYIQQLIGWVSQLLDMLGQFMAGITGHKAYTKAIKNTADAIDEAGKSAASASKQLSKLDELNNLSSGSDADSGAGDWTVEDIPIDDTVQELTDIFKGNDWFDIGRGLTDKIEESLTNIDWGKIKESAKNLAHRLATFLNGFFSPDMFYSVGETLAESLNTAITFILEFGKTLDFENIGTSLSEGVRGFFETFNWEDFAETINVWVQGLADLLKSFLSNKDMWKSIFKGLYDFFSNIELETVALLAAPGLVITIGKALKQKIATALAEQVLTGSVTVGSTTSAGGAVAGGATASVGGATAAGGAGVSVLGSIGAAVATFAGIYALVNGLGQSLAMILPGGKFMGLDEEEWAAANPLYKIFDKDKFEGFFQDFFDNIGLDKFILWLEDAWDSYYGFWSDLGAKTADLIIGMIEKGKELGEKIGQFIIDTKQRLEDFKTSIQNKVEEIKTNITTKVTDIKNKVKEEIEYIINFWKVEVPNWWNNNVKPWFTVEKWRGIIINIKNALVDVWNQVKSWWNTNITSWWNTSVAPWFTLNKWTTLLSPIKTAFSTAFKGAANMAISALNGILGALSTLLNNGVVGALNNLIYMANRLPGVNIPTLGGTYISIPKIPALASGTVIPPQMGEFIARLGDNNSETEVVSPLSTIEQALTNVLEKRPSGIGGDIHLHIEVDGRELAKVLVTQDELTRASRGVGLFGT